MASNNQIDRSGFIFHLDASITSDARDRQPIT